MKITSMVSHENDTFNPLSIIEGKYVDLDGVQIHYLMKGSGFPLLLVHGLGAYSYTWRYNMDQLARFFTVYALDLKGFGLSDKPKGCGYAVESHMNLVVSFMNKLGLRKVHYIGSSMGGEIGLRLCLAEPELVDKLVLIGSSGYVDRIPFYFRLLGYLPYLKPIRYFVQKKYMKEEVLSQIVKDAYFDAKKLHPVEIRNYLYPVYSSGFEEAYMRLLREFDFGKRMSDYHNIKHPALILAGEQDRVIPMEHLQRLHQEIRNSTFIVVEKTGHFLHEENPELANQLILKFLSKS